jgi:uncharacterized lipoprotein YmbA
MKFFALLLAALLAACASADPRLYTLAPVDGIARSGRGPASIELLRPGLAGYLDRAAIVRSDTGYELQTASLENWASPLGEMIGRVLAQDLSQRLPGTAVFTEASALSSDPDLKLETDIQRFNLDANGNLVLVAQTALSRAHQQIATRSVRLTVTPQSGSTRDQAAAMSQALGQLADMLAQQIKP